MRDILQSTLSLAQIAFFLAVGMTMRAAGLGIQPWKQTFGTSIASLGLALVLFDTWFYWGHRLLHTKFLYPRAHRWHHTVTTPVVWSNKYNFATHFVLWDRIMNTLHPSYDDGVAGGEDRQREPSNEPSGDVVSLSR